MPEFYTQLSLATQTAYAHLLAYLYEHSRRPLHEELHDLLSLGKDWGARSRQGAQALNKAYPQLSAGDWLLATGPTKRA